ncbi:hypothetical protein [Lichenifustis flavocetrariae]|uniref:Integrase n=1 Tax=Lichenifustis flavocetrariae TaxID=2949735 RepID=A0AA41Z492_9HYPH|nr:hypothetical protein [Lichenifustis flavocetrariae]MCW6512802.1 hypothetical protein [Lichenifustis flavocetrariae]
MKMTAREPGRPKSKWIADTDAVISKTIHPGLPVPRFGEQRWDLRCIDDMPNRPASAITFESFDEPHRNLAARELVASRLDKPLVSSRGGSVVRRHRPSTCRQALASLRQLHSFMDELGLASYAELTQDDLDLYLAHLAQQPGHLLGRARRLSILVWLWESREYLTGGGLKFDPFEGRTMNDVVSYKQPLRNTTPVVPEAVMGMILRWSLAYLDFSTDIIKAKDCYKGSYVVIDARGSEASRFGRYVAGLRARGEGLPGIRNPRTGPALGMISRCAGVSRAWFEKGEGELAIIAAHSELGMSFQCLGPTSVIPEGCAAPWRAAMTIDEMKAECTNLLAACYIVTAYLSGMRDSEVQDLRRGCVKSELRSNGTVRYKVHGHIRKKKCGEAVPKVWVVIEPVARAIEVLERLTATVYAQTSDPHLFVHAHYMADRARRLSSNVNVVLRRFLSHCDKGLSPGLVYSGVGPSPNPHLGPVPDGPKGPWRLTSSQLRGTLAWHIGNRPFGLVAGAIQYGQACYTVFEGYCRQPASRFPDQVREAWLLGRIGDLTEGYDEFRRGIRPVGGAATRVEEFYLNYARVLGDLPGRVADEAEARRMMRSTAATVHVAPLNNCWFVERRAKCLEGLPLDERRAPAIGSCDPRCPNACVGSRHVHPWQQVRDRSIEHATSNDRRVTRAQREVSRDRGTLAARILQDLREAGHAE